MLDIRIWGHFQKSQATYYKLEIDFAQSQIHVESRYSELLKVHQSFKSLNESKPMPEFPPKQFFSNDDPIFIEQRAKSLEAYFSMLLKFQQKYSYDLRSWRNFFIQNKKEVIQKESMINGQLNETKQRISQLDSINLENTNKEDNLNKLQKSLIQTKRSLITDYPDSGNTTEVPKYQNFNQNKSFWFNGLKEIVDQCVNYCTQIKEITSKENELKRNQYAQELLYHIKAE